MDSVGGTEETEGSVEDAEGDRKGDTLYEQFVDNGGE